MTFKFNVGDKVKPYGANFRNWITSIPHKGDPNSKIFTITETTILYDKYPYYKLKEVSQDSCQDGYFTESWFELVESKQDNPNLAPWDRGN